MDESSQEIIEEFADTLIKTGLASEDDVPDGCSSDEIKQIEEVCGVELPELYRRFLATFGKTDAHFAVGWNIRYPDIVQENEELKRVFKEKEFEFTDSHFIFAVDYDDQVLYFDTKDPELTVFHAAEARPENTEHETFDEWLFEMLEFDIEAVERRGYEFRSSRQIREFDR